MSGVKSVSRNEEASAGDGYFSQPGGLIAQHNSAICAGRTTCCAISTNLPLGLFNQDHMWTLIIKSADGVQGSALLQYK